MREAKITTRAYQHEIGSGYYAVVLRQLPEGTYATEASCRHRHRTPAGAMTCARKMAARVRRRLKNKPPVCAKCLEPHDPTCPVTGGRAATTTIY